MPESPPLKRRRNPDGEVLSIQPPAKLRVTLAAMRAKFLPWKKNGAVEFGRAGALLGEVGSAGWHNRRGITDGDCADGRGLCAGQGGRIRRSAGAGRTGQWIAWPRLCGSSRWPGNPFGEARGRNCGSLVGRGREIYRRDSFRRRLVWLSSDEVLKFGLHDLFPPWMSGEKHGGGVDAHGARPGARLQPGRLHCAQLDAAEHWDAASVPIHPAKMTLTFGPGLHESAGL